MEFLWKESCWKALSKRFEITNFRKFALWTLADTFKYIFSGVLFVILVWLVTGLASFPYSLLEGFLVWTSQLCGNSNLNVGTSQFWEQGSPVTLHCPVISLLLTFLKNLLHLYVELLALCEYKLIHVTCKLETFVSHGVEAPILSKKESFEKNCNKTLCSNISCQKRGRCKGTIPLSSVKAVEFVDDTAFDNNKYCNCFQVSTMI